MMNVFPAGGFASSWHFYEGIDGGVSIVTIQQQNPQITFYDGQVTDSYVLFSLLYGPPTPAATRLFSKTV